MSREPSWTRPTTSPMRSPCRCSTSWWRRTASCSAARARSTSRAPSAWRAISGPDTRLSRCSPIMAPAMRASSTTRNSSAPRSSRCRAGSTIPKACATSIPRRSLEARGPLERGAVSYRNPEALVSTEWLAAHLDAPDVLLLDASYAMPDTGRDAHREYESAHIPGAVFFDIEEIADSKSPYPHMLPPPEKFSSRVRKLGLGDGNRIVVYDQLGFFSAARVWWMFRVFGHEDVAVLDGGLPKGRGGG